MKIYKILALTNRERNPKTYQTLKKSYTFVLGEFHSTDSFAHGVKCSIVFGQRFIEFLVQARNGTEFVPVVLITVNSEISSKIQLTTATSISLSVLNDFKCVPLDTKSRNRPVKIGLFFFGPSLLMNFHLLSFPFSDNLFDFFLSFQSL